MTTIHLQPSFDGPARPQSHNGIHSSSPGESPRVVQRPASQASFHITPGAYSTAIGAEQSPALPFSNYPNTATQNFRFYQPSNLSLPLPHQPFMGSFPSSAPPLNGNTYFTGPAPLYDIKGSQPMVRTISHAHPMNSATDHTVSSRYSSSPHSATHDMPPATAGAAYPSFQLTDTNDRHVNPAIFNSYPMSRSTSGASDSVTDTNGRLLTPHDNVYYRDSQLNSHEAELRKVSDSLGRIPSRGYYNHTVSPHFDLQHQVINGGNPFGAHPQPDMGNYMGNPATRGWGSDFALSAERGDSKPDITSLGDTQYERDRAQQILHNKKLLEEVGLGVSGEFVRYRNTSDTGGNRVRKSSTPVKKRVPSEAPIRASPRIASLKHDNNYDEYEGDLIEDPSDEEYTSDQAQEDDDDFRPVKKAKGGYRGGRKLSVYNGRAKAKANKPELSLWGLLEVYPQIPHLFPLFYYTLNNDLTINSDSVPLIGSIPSTATPLEKAEALQNYSHRGRRVIAQLDAFTSRCDRKYEGTEERWPELDYHTRIAVRDVRRKCVERCENYKYTRRDLLDKIVGKNKWQPIEHGMIEWRVGMAQNDPAGDLANVTLTLPTPPPSVFAARQQQQQQQAQQQLGFPGRQIRPFPNRARIASNIPITALPRTISVNMGEPDSYTHTPATAPIIGYGYQNHLPATPMYGEDQVPMTVNMPLPSGTPVSGHNSPLPQVLVNGNGIENNQVNKDTSSVNGNGTIAPESVAWNESRGVKRSRSGEECQEDAESGDHTEAEAEGEKDVSNLWQE